MYPQQPQHLAPPMPQAPPPAQYQPYPQAPAPQQYAPQPQYAPAPPAPAPGTLDGFYSQPSTGGGASLKFEAAGQSYVGIVTRPITNGDVEQQTEQATGRPAFFRDGRPKLVMKVPLQMEPSPAYPDGLAQWYVKGQARDELARAMAEAGAPEGPPEQGAVIQVTLTGTRPSGAGMNPAKLYRVVYRRPDGAAPVAQPVAAPQPAPTPVPPAAPVPPQAAPAPQPAAPVAAPQPPAALSPEQQALLARLTGQTAPAPQ
ncbi:MAG: hypothetical protein ACRDT4_26670 [Micromonosporaceae bacterium]